MDSALVNMLISLVSGGVAKAKSLGPLWNTVVGALGGIGGGQLANVFGGVEAVGQAGNIGISAIVGALLPLVIGYFKNKSAAR